MKNPQKKQKTSWNDCAGRALGGDGKPSSGTGSGPRMSQKYSRTSGSWGAQYSVGKKKKGEYEGTKKKKVTDKRTEKRAPFHHTKQNIRLNKHSIENQVAGNTRTGR